jgi:hypothetical protein
MKSYVGLAAMLVVLGTAPAYSQSLKEKQYFADQEGYLAKEEVAPTNQKCDIKFDAKFDWPTLPTDHSGYSPYGYCGSVFEAVRRVCESTQAGKDAVKQKVKSVICGFGPERTIALKNGVIDYRINFKSSNDADFVYEFLMNNL